MRINIRGLVKELLEDEKLIVNYNELSNGGFDLSVRINEEAVNSMLKEKITITCPDCGSINVQHMYTNAALNGKTISTHYICNDCQKEFNVDNK